MNRLLASVWSVSEQFRYKRRVYTQSYVDDKQLAKLHTKVTRLAENNQVKQINEFKCSYYKQETNQSNTWNNQPDLYSNVSKIK